VAAFQILLNPGLSVMAFPLLEEYHGTA